MSDLKSAMHTAASGLAAQSTRMRVIAENVANADSVGATEGAEPYRRKIVSFKNELDAATGSSVVRVDKITADKSEFSRVYQPGHPSADEEGYVLKSNVKSMVETMDMREALRSYEANLSTIEMTKTMLSRTLDILR